MIQDDNHYTEIEIMIQDDNHYKKIGIDMKRFYKKGFDNTLTQRDINMMIINDDLYTIKRLIKCGLSIYLLDKANNKAEHHTTLVYNIEYYLNNENNEKYKTIKFLLDNGAMTDFIGYEDYEYDSDENCWVNDGTLFDYILSETKDTKLLDLVLYGNYNINVNLNKRMYNVLMKLIKYNYEIRYMRKVISMNLNIDYVDLMGNNALMVALKHRRKIEILRLLVESGIDIHRRNRYSEDALWIALNNYYSKEEINYIIDCGVDMTETIYKKIINQSQLSIIRFLIDKVDKNKLEYLFEYIIYRLNKDEKIDKKYSIKYGTYNLTKRYNKKIISLLKSYGNYYKPIMNINYKYIINII